MWASQGRLLLVTLFRATVLAAASFHLGNERPNILCCFTFL
jgi:hypothetical protein